MSFNELPSHPGDGEGIEIIKNKEDSKKPSAMEQESYIEEKPPTEVIRHKGPKLRF